MREMVLVALALLPFSAAAEGALRLNLVKPDFAGQRVSIENAVSGSRDFVEIKPEVRVRVLHELNQIAGILAGESSLKALDSAEQAQALALEVGINAALATAQADSKVVCRPEQVLGSNLPKRVCVTAAAHARRFAKEHQETNAIDMIRVER